MTRFFVSITTVVLLLTACSAPTPAAPQIHVEDAWARPAAAAPMEAASQMPGMESMPGMAESETPGEMPAMDGMPSGEATSAAYFVIVNDGGESDTLVGVSSQVANDVSMHETRVENDVAQMLPVASLEIPAHERLEFQPGGYHVMLVGLTQDLNEGDNIQITLQFEKSGALTIDVPIRQEP
ncbi:MAG: copper chaperone PCu(A)C [Chloroflexi bacterium]|nr:copper chaperone PCu(A)C [Anaerolineaceae bacterium]NMB86796.1 copper chaperone PCu(A)C [Chloroflexota bacterium]